MSYSNTHAPACDYGLTEQSITHPAGIKDYIQAIVDWFSGGRGAPSLPAPLHDYPPRVSAYDSSLLAPSVPTLHGFRDSVDSSTSPDIDVDIQNDPKFTPSTTPTLHHYPYCSDVDFGVDALRPSHLTALSNGMPQPFERLVVVSSDASEEPIASDVQVNGSLLSNALSAGDDEASMHLDSDMGDEYIAPQISAVPCHTLSPDSPKVILSAPAWESTLHPSETVFSGDAATTPKAKCASEEEPLLPEALDDTITSSGVELANTSPSDTLAPSSSPSQPAENGLAQDRFFGIQVRGQLVSDVILSSMPFDVFLSAVAGASQAELLPEEGALENNDETLPSILDIHGCRHIDSDYSGVSTLNVLEAVKLKAERRRTSLWKVVIATARFLDRGRFTVPSPHGQDRSYKENTLRPCLGTHSLSTAPKGLPMQQLHISPFAIPSKRANTNISQYHASKLLEALNAIFGTSVPLDLKLESCLNEFINNGFDLGQVYAHTRRRWSNSSRSNIHSYLQRWKREDQRLRNSVLAYNRQRVFSTPIPPRRVWDLYSNRVIPFYALGGSSAKPSHIWTVSHSWVDREERVNVWTSINGKQWPVPIPKGTSLEHIRIELLNLGAEYVFLDVLCLRQEGRKSDESLRMEEWKLDIPFIGHTFQRDLHQTTIIYFNGLGRPLDLRRDIFQSEVHWFNRCWTVQEATVNWLPGGLHTELASDVAADGAAFINQMRKVLDITTGERRTYVELLNFLYGRPGFAAKKPFDRVAALAYLLPYSTRPVYRNERSSAEAAWADLIAHMDPKDRTDLLLRYPQPGDPKASWRPSWEQLSVGRKHLAEWKGPHSYAKDETLKFIQIKWSFHSYGYGHHAYVIRRCYVEDEQHIRIAPARSTSDIEHADIAPGSQGWHAGEAGELFKFEYSCDTTGLSRHDTFILMGIAGLEFWVLGKLTKTKKIGQEYHTMKLNERTRSGEREEYAKGGVGAADKVGPRRAIQVEKIMTGRIADPDERDRLRQLHLGSKQLVVYRDDYFHS